MGYSTRFFGRETVMRSGRSAALLLLLPLLFITLPTAGTVANAQDNGGVPLGDPPGPTVRRTDLYCAGFISDDPVETEFRIIGGEKEDEIREFTTHNVVYLNYGAKNGATAGESLYVVRPRGEYENPFTGKDVGYYHEELAILRIIAVQRKLSIAEVVSSCDVIRIGDMIRRYDAFISPEPRAFEPLDRYGLPTGKLSGQIVLSRNFRSFLAERDIVFIDIGRKQGVQLGQYYTIYRKPGEEEGPVSYEKWHSDDRTVKNRLYASDSKKMPRGDFSIMPQLKTYEENRHALDHDEDDAGGLPRKVVGEIQIIRLEKGAATAIITRVTQEVNIGDFVELQ
jgi:hypothetical protein